jgi:hypothetical protein
MAPEEPALSTSHVVDSSDSISDASTMTSMVDSSVSTPRRPLRPGIPFNLSKFIHCIQELNQLATSEQPNLNYTSEAIVFSVSTPKSFLEGRFEWTYLKS